MPRHILAQFGETAATESNRVHHRASSSLQTKMKSSLLLFSFSLVGLGYAYVSGPVTRQKVAEVSYGRDVRPILGEHCFKCHGPDVGTAAAGLRFDSFANATAKRQNGSAIIPGDPNASLMIHRVSAADPEMRMPPADAGVSALTREQIAVLRTWIAQGARYERHWSFVPPTMPRFPQVRDSRWVRNPIDRFVLERLETFGMKPEPEADRNTLAFAPHRRSLACRQRQRS